MATKKDSDLYCGDCRFLKTKNCHWFCHIYESRLYELDQTIDGEWVLEVLRCKDCLKYGK